MRLTSVSPYARWECSNPGGVQVIRFAGATQVPRAVVVASAPVEG